MVLNYSSDTNFRVRYSETDQMGFCYYGNFASFLEVGRVEALREIGIVYSEVEKQGILLPVSRLSIDYKKPAKYDSFLRLKTSLINSGAASLDFNYEMLNEENDIVIIANTQLIFVNAKSLKPIRIPQWILSILEKYEIKK